MRHSIEQIVEVGDDAAGHRMRGGLDPEPGHRHVQLLRFPVGLRDVAQVRQHALSLAAPQIRPGHVQVLSMTKSTFALVARKQLSSDFIHYRIIQKWKRSSSSSNAPFMRSAYA